MTIEERLRAWKIPVGLRTLKTAVAVILALLVVQPYGASHGQGGLRHHRRHVRGGTDV